MGEIERAVALHRQGDIAAAEALYGRILDAEPDNAEAMHLLGVIALQRGDAARAEELIARALTRQPGRGEFHRNLGLALMSLDRLDDAAQSLGRAIAIDPADAAALTNLGALRLRQRAVGEAIAASERAAALAPNSLEAVTNLAMALRDRGRLADAERWYRRALELSPGTPGLQVDLAALLRRQGRAEEAIEQLRQAARENRELFLGSIRMLAAAIDEKDPYTRGHSGRVAKYSEIIGKRMGLPSDELDKIKISALLHDVGKIGVDDRVLKKPGSLTAEEFSLMKQHPLKGANIMRPVAQLAEMLPGIELHHEHVDGAGYPHGLRGEEIPLMARIIGVADTFDAMTTNRPYQSGMDLESAMSRICTLKGTKFDPAVVEALENAVEAGELRLSPTLVEV